MTAARVGSEREMDELEAPVREEFARYLDEAGLLGTDRLLLATTFRTGGAHFAVKALEFVPPEVDMVVVGTALTREEIAFLSGAGYRVFSTDRRFDNELVYEMLQDLTAGPFGWVDADCFVLDDRIWRDLLAPMADDVASHATFTYQPLGFAKTPLVVWDAKVRPVLTATGTTLNSYAPEPTNLGRASPYSISRIVGDHHLGYLRSVLGTEEDGELTPHDGLLDLYANARTVPSRRRAEARDWFGPDVARTGWLVDTPMMAGVVLRAHGLGTVGVVPDNVQVSNEILHVGASSYRERMRQEGASTEYLARFRLTDLFEVLLADELVARGLRAGYEDVAAAGRRHLKDEAGLPPGEIASTARSILESDGVDLASLRDDPRLGFLFGPGS